MNIRKPFLLAGLLMTVLVLVIISMLGGCYQRPEPTTIAPEKTEAKEEVPAESRESAEKISGYARPEALTSVFSLSEKIEDKNTFIIDARGRSFRVFQMSYPLGHIPGAIPFLHSHYCHPAYPGRIGTPIQIQELLKKDGAGSDSSIVVYGNDGLQARIYWALRMYGYNNVTILDGGFEKWQETGLEVTSAVARRPAGDFEFDLAAAEPEAVLATLNDVTAAVGNPNFVIVDARRIDEYFYKRIPGSVNLSTTELFNEDHTFKWAQELQALVDKKGISPDSPIIVYSNAGVRSSLVWFALSELLGYPHVKNFDGSLNQWVTMERETQSGY